MSQQTAPVVKPEERENLFTKKQEKVFFRDVEDEANSRGEVAVLLKGFDHGERNLIIDERVYTIKQATREHTIQVRYNCISYSLILRV